MNQCKLNKNTLRYVRKKESHRANIFLSMAPTCKEAGFVLSLYGSNVYFIVKRHWFHHDETLVSS